MNGEINAPVPGELQDDRIRNLRLHMLAARRALDKANELYKAIEDADEESGGHEYAGALTTGQSRLLGSNIDLAREVLDYAETMVRRIA